MRYALDYSRGLGLPIMEHCEDLGLSSGGLMHEGWVATRLGLRGIPAAAEEVAVARNIGLAELTGGWLHVCHVSTAGSVNLVRQAKERGVRVTAEVTPHHLTMTDERVLGQEYGIGSEAAAPTASISLSAYDTNTKVSPPLRSRQDVAALIAGLKDGTINAIATDHAPHTHVDKVCEYGYAANGISGLDTALGSLLYLVHSGQLESSLLITRLTAGPAQLLRQALSATKGTDAYYGLGTLKEGAPADITVFDPNREWVVEPQRMASKGKNTPLLGSTLKGQVVLTLVGGKVAYSDETISIQGR
jgi:dihydroorotase